MHSTAGVVIDRFNRLTSKLDGAAKLVYVFLLRNRRGMAAMAAALYHIASRNEKALQTNMRTLCIKICRQTDRQTGRQIDRQADR
jgi:hypothetical protein